MSDDTTPRTAREVAIARAVYVEARLEACGVSMGNAPAGWVSALVEEATERYPLPQVPREFVSPQSGRCLRVVNGELQARGYGGTWAPFMPGDHGPIERHYRGIVDLYDRPTMPAPEES